MSHACVLVALDNVPNKPRSGFHYGSFVGTPLGDTLSAAMEPFSEHSGWFGDGSRWDWWVVGGRYSGSLGGVDVAFRSDLDHKKLCRYSRKEAEDYHDSYSGTEFGEALLEGMSRKEYVTKASHFRTYAFLHNGSWHESERMGWFGGSATTECELKTGEKPNICVFSLPDGKSRTVTWGEEWDIWAKNYWKRFIEDLQDDTLLVVVDYHV